MAVNRIPPKCSKCGADYEAIHHQYTANFIGDTFMMWDIQAHKCKWLGSSGGVLSPYEERLESIIDEIKKVTTVEAIGILSQYIPKQKDE